MRRATPDGAVLIIDENADEHFAPTGDPIQRLLYAFSVLHCLPSGRDADHSAVTGTVMRPDTMKRYAATWASNARMSSRSSIRCSASTGGGS